MLVRQVKTDVLMRIILLPGPIQNYPASSTDHFLPLYCVAKKGCITNEMYDARHNLI